MPSPFPGMNPYLEHPSVWHDFHEQFCVFCRIALLPALRPKYICQLEEHVYIHELSEDARRLMGHGDVTISKARTNRPVSGMATADIAVPVEGQIFPQIDIEREMTLEIRDRQSRELVTVIELLSPSNKHRGKDRDQFLGKRCELLESSANYVELDLLRGGPRLPVENLPACDYYALMSRVEERPKVSIWPNRLRDRLPVISIPLHSSDADIALDLKAVLEAAYDSGGYEDHIYGLAPEPSLSASDQEWADVLLKTSRH